MGIPLTYVDGNGPLTDWFFTEENGTTTDLRYAYMDNVLVFEKALNLILPCNPSYTSLNLRTFINNNNPYGFRIINVLLPSSCSTCSHPTIHSGNTSGLYVVLNIEGSLESGSTTSAALNLTSAITVQNNGCIRGWGGNGGRGKDGADGSGYKEDTQVSTFKHSPSHGNKWAWQRYCGPHDNSSGHTHLRIFWDGYGYHWGDMPYSSPPADRIAEPTCTNFTGPIRLYGDNGERYPGCTFHRWTASLQPSGPGVCTSYGIEKRCGGNKWHDGGSGGAGGNGGTGQYYKHAATSGSSGKPGASGGHPPQTEGGDGGDGGDGGTWGSAGEPGGPNGTGGAGSAGGIAVHGARHLTSASNIYSGVVKGIVNQ